MDLNLCSASEYVLPSFNSQESSIDLAVVAHGRRTKSVSEKRRKYARIGNKKKRPPSYTSPRRKHSMHPLPPPPVPPPSMCIKGSLLKSTDEREIRRSVSEPCAIKQFLCETKLLSVAPRSNVTIHVVTKERQHTLKKSFDISQKKNLNVDADSKKHIMSRKLPKVPDSQRCRSKSRDSSSSRQDWIHGNSTTNRSVDQSLRHSTEYKIRLFDEEETRVSTDRPALLRQEFVQKKDSLDNNDYRMVTSSFETDSDARDFDPILSGSLCTNGSKDGTMMEQRAYARNDIDRKEGFCESTKQSPYDILDYNTLKDNSKSDTTWEHLGQANIQIKRLGSSESRRSSKTRDMKANFSKYNEFESNCSSLRSTEADIIGANSNLVSNSRQNMSRMKPNTIERKCAIVLFVVPCILAVVCGLLFGLSYFGIISSSSSSNKNRFEEVVTTESNAISLENITGTAPTAEEQKITMSVAEETTVEIDDTTHYDINKNLSMDKNRNIPGPTTSSFKHSSSSTAATSATATEFVLSMINFTTSRFKLQSTVAATILSENTPNRTELIKATKRTIQSSSKERKSNNRRRNRSRKKNRDATVDKHQSKATKGNRTALDSSSQSKSSKKLKQTPQAVVEEHNIKNVPKQGLFGQSLKFALSDVDEQNIPSNKAKRHYPSQADESSQLTDHTQLQVYNSIIRSENMKFKSTETFPIEAQDKSNVGKYYYDDYQSMNTSMQENETYYYETTATENGNQVLDISSDDFRTKISDDDGASCVRISSTKCEDILPYSFTSFKYKLSENDEISQKVFDILLFSLGILVSPETHSRQKTVFTGKDGFQLTKTSKKPAFHNSKNCDSEAVLRLACNLRFPPCENASNNNGSKTESESGECVAWCTEKLTSCVNTRILLEMKSHYDNYERSHFGTSVLMESYTRQNFHGDFMGSEPLIKPNFIMSAGLKSVPDNRILAKMVCPKLLSFRKNNGKMGMQSDECPWIHNEAKTTPIQSKTPGYIPDSDNNLNTINCGEGYFQCNTGTCLDWNWTCDGQNDCGQWEDEIGCECSNGQFHCDNGQCIQFDEKCDGYYDCSDRSDERNCSICRPGLLECGTTRQCILSSWWCDGDADCDNAEDERFCSCESRGMFQCGHNLCVPLSYKCDGDVDCKDGLDEKSCALLNKECTVYELSCNHECTPMSSICDEIEDCSNREDEKYCGQCEPIRMDICRRTTYNMTTFPNFLNHQSQRETMMSFEYISFSAIFQTRCHPLIKQLGCSILAPPPHLNTRKRSQCAVNLTGIPDYTPPRLLPCRELCETIQSHCADILLSSTLSWPTFLSCKSLPSEKAHIIDVAGTKRKKVCLDYETIEQAFCSPEEFRCTSSGQCLPVSARCDGINHCDDGSDELTCDCKQLGRFSCVDTGQCIPLDWRCDGHVDCSNGYDEFRCDNCSVHQKVCGDYSCIDSDKWCDGINDCIDGSDEDKCLKLVPGHHIHRYMENIPYSHIDWSIHETSGILVGFQQNRWSPICAEEWTPLLSHLACSQMKFSEALHMTKMQSHNEMRYSIHIDKTIRVRFVQESFTDRIFSCLNNQLIHLNCKPAMCGRRTFSAVNNNKLPVAFTYNIQAKIFGGRTAREEFWPWIASLSLQGKKHVCGATVLNEQWVISAAHCVHGRDNPHHWKVRFGRASRHDRNDKISVNISNIIIHSRFDSRSMDFDVALIKLNISTNERSGMTPICYYDIPPKPGSYCYIAGWGITGKSTRGTKKLQEGAVHITDQVECQRYFPKHAISNRMLCAGRQYGSIDACSGDSGGPMTCWQPKLRQWYLAGVTSWGSACIPNGTPGVYTNIAYFSKWIRKTISEE